jgi:hypothetical protein
VLQVFKKPPAVVVRHRQFRHDDVRVNLQHPDTRFTGVFDHDDVEATCKECKVVHRASVLVLLNHEHERSGRRVPETTVIHWFDWLGNTEYGHDIAAPGNRSVTFLTNPIHLSGRLDETLRDCVCLALNRAEPGCESLLKMAVKVTVEGGDHGRHVLCQLPIDAPTKQGINAPRFLHDYARILHVAHRRSTQAEGLFINPVNDSGRVFSGQRILVLTVLRRRYGANRDRRPKGWSVSLRIDGIP